MSTAISATYLDRLLNPIAESLSIEGLGRVAALKADADLQGRLHFLADKCTEGTLSEEELQEYDTYVHAIALVGILRAKALRLARGEAL